MGRDEGVASRGAAVRRGREGKEKQGESRWHAVDVGGGGGRESCSLFPLRLNVHIYCIPSSHLNPGILCVVSDDISLFQSCK